MTFHPRISDFVGALQELFRESSDPDRGVSISVTFKKYMPPQRKPLSKNQRRFTPKKVYADVHPKRRDQGVLIRATDGISTKFSTIASTKSEMRSFLNRYMEILSMGSEPVESPDAEPTAVSAEEEGQ